jgi:uncharacterized protein YhaN
MTRLVISAVTDVTFGRHDRRSFTGFDSDFVVIHGPNESGKSTLAEFLCWVIGGPSRSAGENSNIFRRGSEDRVGGRVRAALGSDMVDIDANFVLKMRGKPGDERLSTVGKQRFKGADVAQRFGGIEPSDYRLMYWLYGGDLGTIGSVSSFSEVLSRYALGSAGTGTDVGDLLGRINMRIKAKDQEAKAAQGAVKTVNGEINEVAGRPAELANAQDHVQELRRAEADAMQQQDDERDRRVLLESVREGLKHIAARNDARDHRESLGEVSNQWRTVVQNFHDVQSAMTQLSEARATLDTAEENARQAVAACGMDEGALDGMSLSPPERLALSRGVRDALEARAQRDEAEAARDAARAAEETSQSECATREGELGLTPEQCIELDRLANGLSGIRGLSERWSERAHQADNLEAQLAGARSAYENRVAAVQPDTGQGSSAGSRSVAVAAVAVLLAVAAVAAVNRVAAVVAGIVGAVGIWALGRRGASRTDRTDMVVNDDSSDTNILRDLARDAGNARKSATQLHEQVTKALGALAVFVESSALAVGQVDHLIDIAEARRAVRALSGEREQLERKYDAAVAAADSQVDAVSAQLQARHIDPALIGDGFDEWLTEYEAALGALAERTGCRARVSSLDDDVAALFEPVADEVAGLGDEARLQKLHDMRTVAQQIDDADARVRDTTSAVDAARMDSDDARVVYADYATEHDLNIAIERCNDVIEQWDKTLTAQREERIRLESRIEELQTTERLAELSLRKSEAEEARADAEAAKEAYLFAHHVLAGVVDRYEKEHQDPVIDLANHTIARIVPEWGSLLLRRDDEDKGKRDLILERTSSEGRLPEASISDGGRALLYLALCLSFVEHDAADRDVRLPVICDDPFVHFDPERRAAAVDLLADLSSRHQVVLTTTDDDVRDLAVARGASVVSL